jgi:hypothetical protein
MVLDRGVRMSKVLIYSQEDLDLILELEKEKNEELQQENEQLKEKLDCDLQWAFKYEKQVDNWNKLKEYAKEIISTDNELYGTDLLDKMQELEGSDSNVKD